MKTRIALETTAGQGSCLGHTFEHLAYIIANVREPERLCVCLDTAHVFAAGYDLTTEAGTKKMLRDFDRIDRPRTSRRASPERLENRARFARRSARTHRPGTDRTRAFRVIMRDRRFRKIPKVLETPKGKDYARGRREFHDASRPVVAGYSFTRSIARRAR